LASRAAGRGAHCAAYQTSVRGPKRRKATLESGDCLEAGLIWAGKVIGLIEDIPTCATLIQSIITNARERLRGREAPRSAPRLRLPRAAPWRRHLCMLDEAGSIEFPVASPGSKRRSIRL